MIKRVLAFFCLILIVILSLSFISAFSFSGLSSNKLTGKVISGSTENCKSDLIAYYRFDGSQR